MTLMVEPHAHVVQSTHTGADIFSHVIADAQAQQVKSTSLLTTCRRWVLSNASLSSGSHLLNGMFLMKERA